jgi:membrane-associated phospholipid phosphatase
MAILSWRGVRVVAVVYSWRRIGWMLTLLWAPALLHAQSNSNMDQNHGLFGLDRFDENEATGIFTRPNQKLVDYAVILTMAGTALWEGTETRLGKAMWQSVDASLSSGLTAQALKYLTSRPRPDQNSDPRVWFQGPGHMSFPSGETALMSAFATPLIISYHEDQPAVWALALLPLYMGKARMASQGHWLTDVLAGAALGAGMGYLAVEQDQPWVLRIFGNGVYVGLKTKF